MVERYIYSSVFIFGNVKVGPNTKTAFHQQMIEIYSYDNYKIPFNEKLIRRREQAIRAETNELVTEIKRNYKKSQKVYGLEIKRENLKPVSYTHLTLPTNREV